MFKGVPGRRDVLGVEFLATKKSSLFRAPEIPCFDASKYETKQAFHASKYGTNPALLYGYGGFNVTTSPGFNALRIALLEQRFVYAFLFHHPGVTPQLAGKWREGRPRRSRGREVSA